MPQLKKAIYRNKLRTKLGLHYYRYNRYTLGIKHYPQFSRKEAPSFWLCWGAYCRHNELFQKSYDLIYISLKL